MADESVRRARSVVPGAQAPDFALDGVHAGVRGTYRLAEQRGRPVVLVFYPEDASPVCTVQLLAYSEDFARFAELDAEVWALSPQDLDEHEAFAEAEGGFAFPLLADVDREVARAYETLGPLGFYRRAVVIVDGDGIVRWVHRSVSGSTFRPVDEIAQRLAEVRAAG